MFIISYLWVLSLLLLHPTWAFSFHLKFKVNQCSVKKSIQQSITIGSIFVGILTFDSSSAGASDSISNTKSNQWLLPNGVVKLLDPLTLFKDQYLSQPRLLGSGGGGAVFSLQKYVTNTSQRKTNSGEVALKISWVSSAPSVEKECKILQILEETNARNIEHCIGKVQYPDDPRRIMIELEPVVNDATAIVAEVDEDKQAYTVKCIMSTLVDLLASNVVTTDVQVLINKHSGEVRLLLRVDYIICKKRIFLMKDTLEIHNSLFKPTFIDMTEAQIMSKPPTFLDKAQVSSFCTEMFALIPENLMDVALDALEEELKSGIVLPDDEIKDIIESRLQ